MKKLLLSLILAATAITLTAQQQYATILYRNDAAPQATLISNIDSVVVNDVAKVDATYFAAQKDTIYIAPSKESHWKGKKVGFLGDSITQNGEYVASFQDLTGCTAVNYGISATHLACRNSGDTNAFEKRYLKMTTTLDMVIVFGGTNDFGHTDTAPFGEFTDGPVSGKYTYYAGLHRLCKGLKTRFPKIPIVIMTPVHHGYEIDTPEFIYNTNGSFKIGTNATTGKTFKEYVDALKEVAAYYSLIVIDAYSYSNLTPSVESSTKRTYFKDGLHLNAAGGLRLAKWMVPQLETVYEMFYDK